MRHQVSKAAIELIKRFEGYRRKAAQLPNGGWTIGHGHTQTARAGAEVSEQDAEALLIYDLIAVAHAINEWTYAPLTQNQFDALCAFAFNIGLDNFRASSVLRRINEGALIEAACAMELWRKADFEGERIVVDALVRRRSVEKTLFLTPAGGWMTAPTPLLPPREDADFAAAIPAQTPVMLREDVRDDQLVAVREDTPTPPPAAPEPDEEGSPILAAAAALAARLEAIAPETSPAPAAPSIESAEPFVEPTAAAPVAIRTVPGRPIVAPAASTPPAAEKREAVTAPLLLLALVGLALFAWALVWAFSAEPAADGGLFNPLAISWLMGVTGIGCFGVAAYLILERLGGGESGLDRTSRLS